MHIKTLYFKDISTFSYALLYYKKISELLKTKYLLARVAFLTISLREVSTVKGLKFLNNFFN